MTPNRRSNILNHKSPRLGVLVLVCAALRIAPVHGASPFASRVVEYDPAPGQFVQSPMFNDPTAALGAPKGGGTAHADNSSVVTLGGFGGCLVLAFDETVRNEPLNPLGLDAIVFGNAFWVAGNPSRRLSECGVIEISRDENGNGVADDDWFLIPGSHLDYASGIDTVQMTWDSNTADSIHPPSLASWIPPGQSGVWQSNAYLLPAIPLGVLILENPPELFGSEAIFGYADLSPTLILGDMDSDNVVDDGIILPESFYAVPDDPWTVGVSAGSGGGDAFDIDWAIDPTTGEPALLTGFDFIRICNGVHSVLPLFGEKSPEIDAVGDVTADYRGDMDKDGDLDLYDMSLAVDCLREGVPPVNCVRLAGDGVEWAVPEKFLVLTARMTGPLAHGGVSR